MLEINVVQGYSYDEAHDGYGDSSKMESNVIRNRFDVAILELFQAHENQMLSNTGISTRGFTWSDEVSGTNVHSTNFAGMNTASMVTTGRWSSPREDFSALLSDDGHGVSSFDVFDAFPSDDVFLDGVRNGYAFIENQNLGSVNYEIYDAADKGRPNSRNDTTSRGGAKPSLDIQSEYQKESYSSPKSTRLGSESFGITNAIHDAIHDVMVAYEVGDFRG